MLRLGGFGAVAMRKARNLVPQTSFDCVSLVLQGGGALGAYQCGVYEALSEADVRPDWIAGISIGAINGAIIAGNPPGQRVARLREFWELISSCPANPWIDGVEKWMLHGTQAREIFGQSSAMAALLGGAPGFFT